MKLRGIIAGLSGSLLAASLLVAMAQTTHAPARTRLDTNRSLGAPIVYKNLTVIPVYDSTAHSSDAYTTLDEGLKAKVVKVKEAQGGGDVNTLYISNQGNKPLYLMAGEVVLGGQQDRCIGHDTIVLPGQKKIPVTVFCVEHGRWNGRAEFGESAMMVAGGSIRKDAQAGAFAAASPVLADSSPAAGQGQNGRSARLAGRQAQTLAFSRDVGSAQEKVWEGVASKNAKFKATPSSGTYRQVLNMEAGDAHKVVSPYLKAFSAGLGNDPKLVGAVAAVNGKIVAADIFGDPTLFRKLWPKLLRSYAADAAENAAAAPKAAAIVTPDHARAFVLQPRTASSKAENQSDVSSTLRLESKSTVTYRLDARGKMGGKRAGGGGAAALVHENVLGK